MRETQEVIGTKTGAVLGKTVRRPAGQEGFFSPAFGSRTLLLLLGLFVSGCARGAEPPVNRSAFGAVAIKGYDTVAYFTDGQPMKGVKEFQVEWNGAVWRFASAEHRDLFRAAPEKYAPQYGGYCAWAASQGSFAGIDPKVWKIVEGKLYLNYSKKVQAEWETDIPGFIRRADENWPKMIRER